MEGKIQRSPFINEDTVEEITQDLVVKGINSGAPV
jgi:hypothetical protein